MNFYKITFSINQRNERVYPAKIKGVVFTSTQDHPTENFMVAGTEGTVAADGKAIVALSAAEAEALTKQLRDAIQVPQATMLGVPMPPPGVPMPPPGVADAIPAPVPPTPPKGGGR